MERNEALGGVQNAIRQSGGWIVNHTLFSNISATLQFEVPAQATDDLVKRLTEFGLPPALQSEVPPTAKEDIRGTVLLTFIHDESDLKRPVPAFG